MKEQPTDNPVPHMELLSIYVYSLTVVCITNISYLRCNNNKEQVGNILYYNKGYRLYNQDDLYSIDG